MRNLSDATVIKTLGNGMETFERIKPYYHLYMDWREII